MRTLETNKKKIISDIINVLQKEKCTVSMALEILSDTKNTIQSGSTVQVSEEFIEQFWSKN
ncbi:hypothetical protein [Rhodopseudomonas parapalustris]